MPRVPGSVKIPHNNNKNNEDLDQTVWIDTCTCLFYMQPPFLRAYGSHHGTHNVANTYTLCKLGRHWSACISMQSDSAPDKDMVNLYLLLALKRNAKILSTNM